jgi:uncharacterized protein (DUF1778 family)
MGGALLVEGPAGSHNADGGLLGFGRADLGPGGRANDFRGRFLSLGHDGIIVGHIISRCKPFSPLDVWTFPTYSNHMARPKAEKTQSAALRIRLFPEQEAMIREAAELAGISISAWIRERLTRAARREISQAARYEVAGQAQE